MVIVEVCVGSSCHIKGAPDIVALLQRRVQENGLDGKVVLTGSFCTGKCNRIGVTVSVNDETVTGVTRENFNDFWNDKVMKAVAADV